MPPVLASGEILRNGTAVVTTFNRLAWASAFIVKTDKNSMAAISFTAVDLISKNLINWCANIVAFKNLEYWIL